MKQKSKAVAVKNEYALTSPDGMAKMAGVLKQYVVKNKLYSTISGKNYVQVEGWQYAGGLLGLFPMVTSVDNISEGKVYKYKATVDIVDVKSGRVVGRGLALCSNEEGKKKSFDEYAVMSMAQTRAIGKAYRNLIGWTMKLAGYEATPAEEMHKGGEQMPDAKPERVVNVPEDMFDCTGDCGTVVPKAVADFSKKVYGKVLCRDCQAVAKKK